MLRVRVRVGVSMVIGSQVMLTGHIHRVKVRVDVSIGFSAPTLSCTWTQVPKALNREQLGSMVGSADASNPSVVVIAAYVANTSVESDRAVTQCFLEWHEVAVQLDEDGLVIGHLKHIAFDKKDRLHKGKWKGSPCASDCQGNVEIGEDGCIDASAMCPVHLLMYLKVLWARKLGVRVEDIKGSVYADLFLLDDVPKKLVIVAWSETSEASKRKAELKAKGVMVISRAEERASGKKSGLCFEVDVTPAYVSHPWGGNQRVTHKLRSLAVTAAKGARKAGAVNSFGDAYRMKDFTFKLSSKSIRRTFATLGRMGGLSTTALMQRTDHDSPKMLIKYMDPDENIYNKDGENITDVILRGAVVGNLSSESMSATLVRLTKLLAASETEIERLSGLLTLHNIPFQRPGSGGTGDLIVAMGNEVDGKVRILHANGKTGDALSLVGVAAGQGERPRVSSSSMVGVQAPTALLESAGNTAVQEVPSPVAEEEDHTAALAMASAGLVTGLVTPTSSGGRTQMKACTPGCVALLTESPDLAALEGMIAANVVGVQGVHQALHGQGVHVRYRSANALAKRLERSKKQKVAGPATEAWEVDCTLTEALEMHGTFSTEDLDELFADGTAEPLSAALMNYGMSVMLPASGTQHRRNVATEAASMHSTSVNLGLAADSVAQADYDMASVFISECRCA
jgi:hypothetical protein